MTIGQKNKPFFVIVFSTIMLLSSVAIALPYQEAAAAPGTTCAGNINSVSSPIIGNLIVPNGATCTLSGPNVEIQGNVKVGKNANLICADSTITGNVVARGSDAITFINCTVQGNVTIANSNDVFINASTIDGKLTLRGNTEVVVLSSTIGGNATCARNVAQFFDGNTFLANNKNCTL